MQLSKHQKNLKDPIARHICLVHSTYCRNFTLQFYSPNIMNDMEQSNVKELPYGIQDFATIVEQNIYYVDKTMYIPELEKQARNLFFIRPRRFGKSIFLSMLHAYYDCRTKDKFQQWFGDL